MKEVENRTGTTPLWEYALRAELDDATKIMWSEVQDELKILKGGKTENIRPQLLLVSFQAKEMMEETLVRWINNICQLESSFEIRLNNFGGIPPHTIYIRVQDRHPFAGFLGRLRELDTFIQASECPSLQFVPLMLPIAGDLPETLYHTTLNHYAGRSFSTSFKVKEIVLARSWSAGGEQEVVRRFHLVAN